MKYIIILAFMGAMSCAPTPTELPPEFTPEFEF